MIGASVRDHIRVCGCLGHRDRSGVRFVIGCDLRLGGGGIFRRSGRGGFNAFLQHTGAGSNLCVRVVEVREFLALRPERSAAKFRDSLGCNVYVRLYLTEDGFQSREIGVADFLGGG